MVTRGSSRCHPRGLSSKRFSMNSGGGKTNSNVPNNENSWILSQLVLLSTYFKVDLTPDCIAEVNLAIYHVGEGGCT